METPWHAEIQIKRIAETARAKRVDPETIVDRDITDYKEYLAQSTLKSDERADSHAILARSYWLKAYLQSTYVRQNSCLQLSLNEMLYALDYYESQQFSSDKLINEKIAQYEYNAADLYHQLKDYFTAEKYYLKAMKRLPGNPMFYRRYTDMIQESGLPQKIDYDAYFRRDS